MRILVAAPPALRELAERMADALSGAGHTGVADAGGAEERAPTLGRRPDVLVLLLAPDALVEGSRARRHLERAARRWSDPAGRVIPLLVAPTPLDDIPPYLRSVAFLVPTADPAAEVLAEIDQIAQRRQGRTFRRALVLGTVLGMVLLAAAALASRRTEDAPAPLSPAPLDTIVLPEALASRARVVATPGMPELTDRVAACIPLPQPEEETCTRRAREELERYYFVGVTSPGGLLRLSHDGVIVGRAAVEGEPRALAFSGDTVYVATVEPERIHAFAGDSLTAAWSRDIRPPAPAARRVRAASATATGIVAARDTLWLLTKSGDGADAAVIALGSPNGSFRRLDFRSAGSPTRIRRIGDAVWGAFEASGGAATLMRFSPGPPTVLESGEAAWTACADDLADAGGDLIIVSCEDEVLDLRAGQDRLDVLLRYGRLSEGAGAAHHEIAAGLAGWTIAVNGADEDHPDMRVFRIVPGARPWLVLEQPGHEPVSVAAAAGTTFIIARESRGRTRAWLIAGSRGAVAPAESAR